MAHAAMPKWGEEIGLTRPRISRLYSRCRLLHTDFCVFQNIARRLCKYGGPYFVCCAFHARSSVAASSAFIKASISASKIWAVRYSLPRISAYGRIVRRQ